MALTIHAIQSDSKPRQHRRHINHCKHWHSSACRNHTTATQRQRTPQPRPRRATATPRDVTATSRRPCPGTPRHPGHDGHATARPQPRHGHDGHDGHGHDRIRGTCPRDTTRHAKTQSHKRSNVAPCNKHPRGGVSPRHKKQGRWLSSADAECSLEHFWITRYLRSLHIFSGCNRFCTLHIVYNVPWIDVDGGRAQLGSASISGCYHSLRVA